MKIMKKIACIILNYNDAESVINLVKKIHNYSILKKIIIVDNCSSDDSLFRLRRMNLSNVEILESLKNGGYGYGNNIGIKHALRNGFEYVLVCNPDVEFTEDSIEACLGLLENNKKCIACSPKVNKGQCGYKIENSFKDLFYSTILLNKIIKSRLYSPSYFKDKNEVQVDAIPGSLTLFNALSFFKCGLYDENIFLYHEEISIAQKFKQAGFMQFVNLKYSFIHNHSVSVNKSIKSAFRLKRITMDSHYYYLKTYCKANQFILFIHKLMRPFCYLELFIWRKIKAKLYK